jgi:hypothetical protein
MNEKLEEKLQRLPDDDKLFNLAYWSKVISWVLVIIGVFRFTLNIYQNFFQIYNNQSMDTGWGISLLSFSLESAFSIGVYFFVLQAVGEILYLVIDIKERLLNTEE